MDDAKNRLARAPEGASYDEAMEAVEAEDERVDRLGRETHPSAEASPLHPHEPKVAPVYDPEGRCLICSCMVASDEMRAWMEGHRSYTNIYAHHERAEEVVAVLDAQEVVKLAAALRGFAALIEVFDGR